MFGKIIILCIILFSSCSRESQDIHKEIIPKKLKFKDNFKPQVYWTYELYSKYAEIDSLYSTENINKWWNNHLEYMEEITHKNPIYPNSGGGPNGAEWNAHTNLYVSAYFPIDHHLDFNKIDTSSVKVSINGSIVDNSLIKMRCYRNTIMIYFVLDKHFWTDLLRSIEPKDYSLLYGKEYLKEIEKGERIPISSLNTGQVLKAVIEINLPNKNRKNVIGYYHIVYGE